MTRRFSAPNEGIYLFRVKSCRLSALTYHAARFIDHFLQPSAVPNCRSHLRYEALWHVDGEAPLSSPSV